MSRSLQRTLIIENGIVEQLRVFQLDVQEKDGWLVVAYASTLLASGPVRF